MVGMLYLHDQSRTARLDVPAAAFALLYVAVGIEALRRNSARWAVAAGAVFALGFLIKEIGLPFLPIPFFASVLWGLSWVVIGRITAWTVLVASIGVAPWFALYASETGRAYRAETPAWTLIPVALGIGALVVIGLTAGRIAEAGPVAARGPLRTGRAPRVDDPTDRRPRRRAGLGRRPALRIQQDRPPQGRPDPDAPATRSVRRHVDQAVLVRGAAGGDRARAVARGARGLLAPPAAPADGRPDHRRDLRRAPGDLRGRGRGAAAQLPGPARARRAARGDRLDLGRRVVPRRAPGVDHRAAGDRSRARRRRIHRLAPADRPGGARRHRRRPDRVRPRLAADARSAGCARRLVVRAARDGRDGPRPVARHRLGRAGPPHPAGAADRQRPGPRRGDHRSR